MKLLIVDDNPINLKVLRFQLEAEKQEVLQAVDGVEALELLRSQPVDGVISDILMPRMDGYRFCMEVRHDPALRHLPFILYTSTYNSPGNRELSQSLGADAYVVKPAPARRLVEAVQAAARAPTPRPGDDGAMGPMPLMKQYNEVLIRKLEERGDELVRTHEGLAESKARLSGLIASAMDAIIAVDDTHQVVLFNVAAGTMFGCDPDAALGRRLGEFMPDALEPDPAPGQDTPAQHSLDASAGVREVFALRADGSRFPVEANVSRLSTPRGQLFTLFIRDITERHRAEAELKETAAGLRRAQALAQLSHAVIDAQGRVESNSDSFAELFEVGADALPRTRDEFMAFVHPDDQARVTELAAGARRDGKRIDFEYRLRSGGQWRHIRHILEPLVALPGGGAGLRTFNTLQDNTVQKAAEEKILRLSRMYAVLSDINSLIVRAKDSDELFQQSCRIIVETGGFCKAWVGLVEDGDSPVHIIGSAGAPADYFGRLQERLRTQGSGVIEEVLSSMRHVICNDMASNAGLLDSTGLLSRKSLAVAVIPLIVNEAAIGVIAIHSPAVDTFDPEEMTLLLELADDIGLALDRLMKTDRINYLGNHDSLTGLPNRLLFTEMLGQQIAMERLSPDGLAVVVLLDLVRFRRVNDMVGRKAGDDLLRAVASRLHAIDPRVARVGSDVFALQLEGSSDAAALARECDELADRAFGEPFPVAGESVRIHCRMGAAVFPMDGGDAESLLLNAEAALCHAKESLVPFSFYAPEMNSSAADALAFESKLRRALALHQFLLHYQPKVRLADRLICGAEALIRWQDPDVGLVPPIRFISVLEETGLIRSTGKWAVARALADGEAWGAPGGEAFRVAVNVSPLELNQPDFVAQISDAVSKVGGAALELEITESVIMDDVDRKIAMLAEIQRLGVPIAVDDFGTGYSSLSYIAKLPINSLKIDRAFVSGMTEGLQGYIMVSSIIALAHALGLKVVAEGVETEEQARMLLELKCDEAQGYLFSRPVPAEQLTEMLAAGLPLPLPKR